jgi:AcrR family transcriptional regulator
VTPTEPVRRRDGRTTRWEGQRDLRRREFVDAALRAISRHGPDVSTEQIAEEAGVARSRMYRYFTDGVDLQRAVADRAVSWVNASLAPLWKLSGTPMEMVRSAINSHMRWLSQHSHLYMYLSRHALTDSRTSIVDIKTAICQHLARLFEHYLSIFGIDVRVAEPVAYGVVGMVESSVIRWLDHPNGIEQAELAERLGRWVWNVIDDTLREGGIELDPHAPLDVPDLPFPSEPDRG